MIIQNRRIEDKNLTWLLRCPTKNDAIGVQSHYTHQIILT